MIRDVRGRRLAALAVDAVPPLVVLGAALVGALAGARGPMVWAPLVLVLGWLLLSFDRLAMTGATAGLLLLHLRLLDVDARLPLGRRRLLHRLGVQLRLLLTPLGVGLLVRSHDAEGRSWADRAVGSVVVPDASRTAEATAPAEPSSGRRLFPRRRAARPSARTRGVSFGVDGDGLYVTCTGQGRVVVTRADGLSLVVPRGRSEHLGTGDRVFLDGVQVLRVGA